MGEGRGSARPCLAKIGVALFCILVVMSQAQQALAAVYTVGGNGGWTFNVNNWPRGKSFRAADVLAFNYARSLHNVVQVSKSAYDTCSSPKGARVYQTGRDRLKLRKGHNYFICTFPGHCQGGMKIDVVAA